MQRFKLVITIALIAVAVSDIAFAADKSGVDPSKLHLPRGPGSLEGIGANAEPQLGMGLVTYSVPIQVPAGRLGLTPSLALSYNSGAGSDTLGIGWSLSVPSIERMTSRGLPRYSVDDAFVADGSEELVRTVSRASSRFTGQRLTVYRARFEKAFVRYTWVDTTASAGRGGYWIAEYPDGRVGYFGATQNGVIVPEALVQSDSRVFRYHLVEMVSPLGESMVYRYAKEGFASKLVRIEWVGGKNRVDIAYETRPDEASNGKPGFDVRLSSRVQSISVLSHGKLIRRYVLSYADDGALGSGISRLMRVAMLGSDNTSTHPVMFSFSYTSGDASVPYVHTMGSVGVDFTSGVADLVDINGDGLPDVIDTTRGRHLFHINRLMHDGSHVLGNANESQVATFRQSAWQLSSPKVDLVDIDGDGLTDMFDGANRSIAWNRGSGDWASSVSRLDIGLPHDFGVNPNYRFFDYDGDKKPDVLASLDGATFYYRNLGDGRFASTAVDGDFIGVSFAHGLQMADINGDGLQDAVQVLGRGLIRTRLYLGYGMWTPWREIFGLPTTMVPDEIRFADLDGDALSDAVIVRADRVLVYRNVNGTRFDTETALATPSNGALPIRGQGVSIRFADMNGNGSNDVVWIDSSGRITYLELFPERAMLLASVRNGIGQVLSFAYGTTTKHRARDAALQRPWTWPSPNAFATLDAIDTFAEGSTSHTIRTFQYHDGYYDGVEHQFRGFAAVDALAAADDSVEQGLESFTFDIGIEDRYRKGLILRQISHSSGNVLHDVVYQYSDCPIAHATVAQGAMPSRFVYMTEKSTSLREGQRQESAIRLKETYAYDAYGNQTSLQQWGRIDTNGDERFTETSYIAPSDATGQWLLRAPYRQRVSGDPNFSDYQETLTYYDGDDFVGLPLRQVTRGLVKRVSQQIQRNRVVDTQRFRHDGSGNVLEVLDANGHAREFEYDADGVLPIRESIVFDSPGHAAYALSMRVSYHPLFETPVTTTAWMKEPSTNADVTTQHTYDVFGRIVAIAQPGDTLDAPTEQYIYRLQSPRSQIITRTRSVSGGPTDIEAVQCFDGLGRKTQHSQRVATDAKSSGYFRVRDFSVYNTLNQVFRTWQPFAAESSACLLAPPVNTRFTEHHYDALKRLRVTSHPDAEIYGSRSTRHVVYRPLSETAYDELDSDKQSSFYNTPVTTYRDGLARVVSQEHALDSLSNVMRLQWGYDSLGYVASLTDSQGNKVTQQSDLLGRVLRVDSPDTGATAFTYDAVGNLTQKRDARGVTLEFAYDEANRLLASWDQANPVESRTEYTYDAHPSACPDTNCTNLAGRLAQVVYPYAASESETKQAVDRFGYDARGQSVFSERRLDGMTWASTTRFDNAGRVTSRTYPQMPPLDFAYNTASELVAVPGLVSTLRYAPHGSLSEMILSNGVHTRLSYDALMRPAARSHTTPDGTSIQHYLYHYDRTGMITGIDNPAAVVSTTSSFSPSVSSRYDYDALRRLTGARIAGESSYRENLQYSYDSIGNLLSKTSSLGSESAEHLGLLKYTSKRPHAVSEAGGGLQTYDAAGYVINTGSMQFGWNARGQLESAHDRAGTTVGVYSYNADGQRVKKIERNSVTYYITPDFEVRDGVATLYIRLGNSRLVKLETGSTAPPHLDSDKNGIITAHDAYLATQTGDSERAKQILQASARRLLLAQDEPVTITYLHTDHLGSVTATTDIDGMVTDRAEYYPYGTLRQSQSNIPPIDAYGWTGQEVDQSTNLSYHAARYYKEPYWLSADPLFDTLNEACTKRPIECANRYAYALNNPVNFTDPTGREAAAPPQDPRKIEQVGIAIAKTAEFFRPDEIDIAFIQTAGQMDGPAPAADALAFMGVVGRKIGTAIASLASKAEVSSKALTHYWPSKYGFIGETSKITLQPGQIIDRFGGSAYSRFFSPQGTPVAARAIPPETAAQPLRTFEVLKPLDVESGLVSPAFGELGFGTQYRTSSTLQELLKNDFLREVK